MPAFQPRLQIPQIITPPISAQPAPTPASTGEARTLDALMQRQKDIANSQQQTMQMPVASNEQGMAQLAWALVNGLRGRKAERDLASGQREVADAFRTGFDPKTGEMTSDAMGVLAARQPELAAKMAVEAASARRAELKQGTWDPVPTPAGETGQWFRNSTTGETKKVGGGTDTTQPKLSDIAALRQDVIGDAAYKNMEQAQPIWQSIQDAATRDTPQADLNMIVGLAKLFDPTSVVRTQEGEAVKQTGDLPTEIYSQYAYLTGQPGARLSDEIRQGMLEEGWSRMKSYVDAYGQTAKTYTDIAKRHGVLPEDIVPTFGAIKPYERPAPEDPNNPPADPNKPDRTVTTEVEPLPPAPAGSEAWYPTPEEWKNWTPESRARFIATLKGTGQ